jgi:hypothetical protein
MDAQQIMSTVRSGQVPVGWNIWPLNVERVRKGLLSWFGIALLGFVLFIPAALATIPANFEHGAGGAFVTLLLLAVLATLAFGGLSIVLYDIWRLRHADEFYIVMTPDDFVETAPRRTVHVPMEYVKYVTLRGARASQQEAVQDVASVRGRAGSGSVGTISITPYMRPRQPRTSPSLAFVDARDDSVVKVASDDSFENLFVLEQVLSDLSSRKQRSRPA